MNAALGFSGANREAREGNLEVTVTGRRGRTVSFNLPWFFVREVDAQLASWREEEHDAGLLGMNEGNRAVTLQYTANSGGLHDVQFLLDRGADVHASEDLALHAASQFGHLETVRLLLDRGANMHAAGDYALRWASRGDYLETVRLLLDRGADVHAYNDYALRMARIDGHKAVVALLLERGAG